MKRFKKILLIIGDGLGNLVAQTPFVAAMARIAESTLVWAPRSPDSYLKIFDGMSQLNVISNKFEDAFSDPEAIAATWLFGREASAAPTIGDPIRVVGPNPLVANRNEVESCMFLARRFGWVGPMPDPYVSLVPTEFSKRVSIEKKLTVAISTGRKRGKNWALKEYPAAYYSDALRILRTRLGPMSVVHVGSLDDTPLEGRGVIDVRGEYTLPETAEILKQCDFFLGNDTGLSWLSSAVGTRTFSVFGPTDPVKCLPPWKGVAIKQELWCQPCQRLVLGVRPDGSPCNNECMRDFSPKMVASVIADTIDRRKSYLDK
jgi:hypothetical protein